MKRTAPIKNVKKAAIAAKPIVSESTRKAGQYSRERLDEDISICLNCTKKKCTGNCAKIEESRREMARARKLEEASGVT